MSDARKYEITVSGCDDETSVTMELTAQEYDLIDRLADLILDRSEYSCMPVMEIGEAGQ